MNKLQISAIFFAITAVIYCNGQLINGSGIKCGPNAATNSCGQVCEPTCEKPNPDGLCGTLICTGGILTYICRCNDGYVRNSDGNCVKLDDCTATTTTAKTTTKSDS